MDDSDSSNRSSNETRLDELPGDTTEGAFVPSLAAPCLRELARLGVSSSGVEYDKGKLLSFSPFWVLGIALVLPDQVPDPIP